MERVNNQSGSIFGHVDQHYYFWSQSRSEHQLVVVDRSAEFVVIQARAGILDLYVEQPGRVRQQWHSRPINVAGFGEQIGEIAFCIEVIEVNADLITTSVADCIRNEFAVWGNV